MADNIIPLQNTNNMRMADFVRVTTASATYRFATTANVLTIPAVDALPFDALGSLVKIGDVQRDIKSTANETSITLPKDTRIDRAFERSIKINFI